MNFYPVFSQTSSCTKLKETLQKENWAFFVDTVEDADVILVWGWDGTMLRALRKYCNYNKPFFWVNCGTLWFLMNRDTCVIDASCGLWDIEKSSLELIPVQCIDVEITTVKWEKRTGFVFNDLVLGWTVLDYMHAQIYTPDETLNVSWTWIIVTTSLWSTWYAINNSQPIIPLRSSLRWISGLATGSFKYMYAHPSRVTIEVSWRSTLLAWLDGTSEIIKWISSVTLSPWNKTVTLAFLASEHFSERRLLLAEEKLGR